MRALILVAGAALAVSACSSKEAANNTMNVDTNMTTENVTTNDTTAVDATSNMGGNMAADANMSMNATDMNAMNASNTTTNTTKNAM